MEVKVGHATYKVVDEVIQTEESRCGVTYKQLSLIQINPNLSPDVRRETLLHEVMHAVCYHVGIDDDETLTEEQWISRISPTLLSVLQGNIDLLEALDLYDA